MYEHEALRLLLNSGKFRPEIHDHPVEEFANRFVKTLKQVPKA